MKGLDGVPRVAGSRAIIVTIQQQGLGSGLAVGPGILDRQTEPVIEPV